MPVSVKISSSEECSERPSTMLARGTPPSTARRAARILGIIPDSRDGSIPRSSGAVSEEISDERSGQSA